VKPSSLRDYSKKVRTALQLLIETTNDEEEKKYTEYKNNNHCQELLRDVAVAGYNLYDQFLTAFDSETESGVREARQFLEKYLVKKRDIITFRLDESIHIPWGLFYDQRVTKDQEIDPEEFWCIKYNVGAQYGLCRIAGVMDPWPSKEFPLLLAAHQTLWAKEYEEYEEYEASEVAELKWREHLKSLLEPDQPKFSAKELATSWSQRKTEYGLLAFYCHADGTALNLGADTMTSADFRRELKRPPGGKTPPTLVFLAGCQTAIGDLETGFLEETSQQGFCGCISTEAEVPARATLEFLSEFLYELYERGGPVFEVMTRLRGRHPLLSLAFSMCCLRELTLIPRAQSASDDRARSEERG
jgi:hypothetical protein